MKNNFAVSMNSLMESVFDIITKFFLKVRLDYKTNIFDILVNYLIDKKYTASRI